LIARPGSSSEWFALLSHAVPVSSCSPPKPRDQPPGAADVALEILAEPLCQDLFFRGRLNNDPQQRYRPEEPSPADASGIEGGSQLVHDGTQTRRHAVQVLESCRDIVFDWTAPKGTIVVEHRVIEEEPPAPTDQPSSG
jgi:hypothetical protein